MVVKDFIERLKALNPEDHFEVQVFVRTPHDKDNPCFVLELADDDMVPVNLNGEFVQINTEIATPWKPVCTCSYDDSEEMTAHAPLCQINRRPK
jgi:hypothetical protein